MPSAASELARLLQAGKPMPPARHDDPSATREFGPRPPVRTEAEERRSKAPFLLLVLPLVVGLVLVGPRAGGTATRSPSCTDASIPVPAGAQIVRGDTAGIGCVSTGVYADGVLTIGLHPTDPQPRRFALGRPGDTLFLGDWNCDGIATAALFRSSTGATLYYDTWSTSAAPSDDADRCRSIS
jgi:hypothetical protein